MPYVPSKKTDGKSRDREVLDTAVELLAHHIADELQNKDVTNLFLIRQYRTSFTIVANALRDAVLGVGKVGRSGFEQEINLAYAIEEVGNNYDYKGAYLGELNYAITRLIQRVPQIMVERGAWKDEIRYWLYAATVTALTHVAHNNTESGVGISGVFEDIKDEYKRRVNTAYEAAQIVMNGDCYDTPYYTRLIEVRDADDDRLLGHQEVMLQRSEETLHQNVLDYVLYVKRKKKQKQNTRAKTRSWPKK